ncbi:MAG TPA: OmpH family outer membrane protein [Caulobacteraceae bacterium]|nr:OmpH family outer membrane protein [Caulobacteraceae bacterium]
MTSRKLGAAVAGATAAFFFASSAIAQTAQPAAAAVTHGAAIPGVCYLSTQEALGTSTVGRHVNTRMQQLIQAVNAELQPEQTAIETEARNLQSATLDAAARQTRGTALQTRLNTFQTRAAQRQRELEATQQKAFARVLQEMDPIAKQQYQTRRCAILLDRESVMLGNPAMDLTPAVIQGLNARIQTFAFERERLDAQPAAAR